MELWKGKPIFYGLGNFLFDERGAGLKDTWYSGYMVVLDFEKDKLSYEIVPYRQCDGKPGVHPFSDTKERKSFQAKFYELNGIICNRDRLEDCQRKYYSEQVKSRLAVFEPWRSRIMKVAYNRGWLPSMIRGNSVAPMMNYIVCESHRDIVQYALTQKIKSDK